ncbi:hypothetical protein STEG23_003574 [Scotinomys teguina]
MLQGAVGVGGPLWGWDDDGDDDWDGAALTLLALAVVATIALALQWFGSRQDQEAQRSASTAPGVQPAQAGGVRVALHPKSKDSDASEGQSKEPEKSEAPRDGQRRPATARARDPESSRGRSMASDAWLSLKTPGEVVNRGTTPAALGKKRREPPGPETSFQGHHKARDVPVPIMIRFTPRSPDSNTEIQVEATGACGKGAAQQGPDHTEQQDTSPWHLAVGPLGPPGRSLGSLRRRRRRPGASSGDRPCRPLKLDPLRLGTVVSVWDAVDTAAAASQDIFTSSSLAGPSLLHSDRGLKGPEEIGLADVLDSRPRVDSKDVCGRSGLQLIPTSTAGSGAKDGESREPGSSAPRETQGILAGEETWSRESGAAAVISNFSPSRGALSEEQHPEACEVDQVADQSKIEKLGEVHLKGKERGQGEQVAGSPAAVQRLVLITDVTKSTGGFNCTPSHNLPASPLIRDADLLPASAMAVHSSPGFLHAVSPLAPLNNLPLEVSQGPSDPRGEETKKKSLDSLPPSAKPVTDSQLPVLAQPGPGPSTVKQDTQPIPQPRQRRKRSLAQSSEQILTHEVPQQPQGRVLKEGARPAGSREVLTEKQKETQKLMIFLQKPGSWGVVDGRQKSYSQTLQPTTTMALWPPKLDLGSCLEVLAFAQQHGELGLAQETYVLMSNNLLHVLGDPHLYRQLSGADRERILNLRTCQGQTVLGVLVLPSLYQVSRSGLTRAPHGEEAPATRPEHLHLHTYIHVFNPQENVWRPLTQVPEEVPLRGCGLCTMHNYLFLAGGIRGSGAKAVCSNKVFCYNPLTNIWSQVRPMQQARAQLKLVALDGMLYAIGGECLYSMERYDPRTDTWTLRASLPEGTFPVAHEAVVCRGDIYVTGGHLFYRLLRYSPEKDSWDECPYSASHRRSSDMVALGGFLYRFDLLRGVGAAVMRYNTVTGSWSRAASLPLPDPAPLHCTVLGNTIYCLNHQVTATFTVSEGTAQFQAKELQPFPLGSKGVLYPFTLTLPPKTWLQTTL